jgi:hypothetical protein
MTSVVTVTRQVAAGGLYVNLAVITNAVVFTEAGATAAAASATFTVAPTTVSWSPPATGAGTVFLKDMGTTISGNGLTFREVQLVSNDAPTFGVDGTVANGFQTGYILLGTGTAVGAQSKTAGYAIAPVAKLSR